MDNIYDFIMEKQMVYIFPEKYTENECDNELLLATAVVANLYYQYTLSFYIYVLFPLLKEGGVYLYEDCHSSYYKSVSLL